MGNKAHIGSDFDDFLREEGLLEESSAVALKRVIAWQLGEAMRSQRVTKSEMASRMGTSRRPNGRFARARFDDMENRQSRFVTATTSERSGAALEVIMKTLPNVTWKRRADRA